MIFQQKRERSYVPKDTVEGDPSKRNIGYPWEGTLAVPQTLPHIGRYKHIGIHISQLFPFESC